MINTGSNSIVKIKLSIYVIMLLLFVNFAPMFHTITYAASYPELGGLTPEQWYNQNGSNIVFEPSSQLLIFVTNTKAAANKNVTRYTTIGWQIRFIPHSSSYPKYYTWTIAHKVAEQIVGLTAYTAYAIPISPSSGQIYTHSIFECLMTDFGLTRDYLSTVFTAGVDIYLDAILSIKEPRYDVPNGVINSNRRVEIGNPNAPDKYKGEYYLTESGTSNASSGYQTARPTVSNWDKNGGIKKARNWANPNAFSDYFNKKIQFKKEEVIVQKTVYRTHWSGSKRLDPDGKPMVWQIVDIRPGQTIQVMVQGLTFPGYEIEKSAVQYTDKGGEAQEIITGPQAINRPITVYPDRQHHYVYFYYKPVNPSDEEASGYIIFEPSKSADIPGNRDEWVNKNITVKVYISPGSETIKKISSESRSYEYYNSCYSLIEVCETLPDGSKTCRWECSGKWVTSSISCSFEQTWKATQLYVTGSGKTASGSTVSIGPFTISNGGTITISNELKQIRLSARVSKWEPQDDRTFTCGSPPAGYWTKNTPTSNTPEPDETYDSTSGLYYLDKTRPTIDSINAPDGSGTQWFNTSVNIGVQASDNLSGFYDDTSYIKVINTNSGIQKYSYFTYGRLSETKNITLDDDGIYNVEINLEDIAQNKISQSIGTFKIDTTPPYPADFLDNNRQYIDEDITTTVFVGDNLSGVEETRYIINNTPSKPSSKYTMTLVPVTTPEGREGYNYFTVTITEPGSWWIHVYQRDRAGNETWTTSDEYRIIRLGNPDNRSGQTFIDEGDGIWTSPLQMNNKIPRATRFDILLKTYGLNEEDAEYATVYLTVPRWVEDEVDKKVNGKYAVTSGTTTHTMNYYSGYAEGPQIYATPNTVLRWWKAYVAPYGTPATLDREGKRLRSQYEVQIQLELDLDDYYPNKTHVSTLRFDIIPETKIKTEIINNEY